MRNRKMRLVPYDDDESQVYGAENWGALQAINELRQQPQQQQQTNPSVEDESELNDSFWVRKQNIFNR
jgi:hypothetical protein